MLLGHLSLPRWSLNIYFIQGWPNTSQCSISCVPGICFKKFGMDLYCREKIWWTIYGLSCQFIVGGTASLTLQECRNVAGQVAAKSLSWPEVVGTTHIHMHLDHGKVQSQGQGDFVTFVKAKQLRPSCTTDTWQKMNNSIYVI